MRHPVLHNAPGGIQMNKNDGASDPEDQRSESIQ